MRPDGRSVRQFRRWGGVYAVFALCLVTGIPSPAQTFTVLADFDKATGGNPYSQALVQGFDGNFYGTTGFGGAHGSGAVFKLTPSGTLTVIYSFCPYPCTAGANPGPLVLNTDGNFYGTNRAGGMYRQGTIFKITPGGTLTTLHTFCPPATTSGSCPDGRIPLFMVLATDGNFYGATQNGGAYQDKGTIFKITPTGTLTTLHSFFCPLSNCPDGYGPSSLIQATDGNFYGTTYAGGPHLGGTVFKITPTGTKTTIYNFCSQKTGTDCLDGAAPVGGLVQVSSGAFYGTTGGGGTNSYGTVFKITSSGTLSTLYSFCSQTNCPDGVDPSSLIQATDGKLYGTDLGTGLFGSNGAGTVFDITTQGALTTLYSFFCSQTSCTDGSNPSGLLQATDGNFYGLTGSGGTAGFGVTFKLSTGLGPFVRTLPTSGKVGAAVTILGTNLTGASSVKFNGTAATLTVVSSSEITTTVPTGATTGKVTVTTPTGTLKSNVVFRVHK